MRCGFPNPHPRLRRITNPSQLSLGRYPTTRGPVRMSPRGRNKFLFAGFRRISLTRLLDLQSKTGKKQAFFAQNSPFAQCFMGDFYFLGLSGPEILPPGRENPGPGKEIPGPGIFFPGPVFSRRRPGSPFSRYLELFHRQIPDVNMSAQAPPG